MGTYASGIAAIENLYRIYEEMGLHDGIKGKGEEMVKVNWKVESRKGKRVSKTLKCKSSGNQKQHLMIENILTTFRIL